MKPAPVHPWPPLITDAKVPWFTRVRDWIITLFAWFALAYALRLGLALLWRQFFEPILAPAWTVVPPDWGLVWQRASPFVYMIVAVVTWIIFWGVMRRAQLRRTFDSRKTPSLPLEEHAASLGLDPREIEEWRRWRVVTVHFDGNRIATARPGGSDDAASADRTKVR